MPSEQGAHVVDLTCVPDLSMVLQDVDHIESHTFATSTSTQFCILFKRTFICILRDTVRAGEAGPGLRGWGLLVTGGRWRQELNGEWGLPLRSRQAVLCSPGMLMGCGPASLRPCTLSTCRC